MKSAIKEFWVLCKNSCNWDGMNLWHKLIILWWCISLILVTGEASFWIMALSMMNFAASSYTLIKYVPEPKDED